jgi:hypothetical protein
MIAGNFEERIVSYRSPSMGCLIAAIIAGCTGEHADPENVSEGRQDTLDPASCDGAVGVVDDECLGIYLGASTTLRSGNGGVCATSDDDVAPGTGNIFALAELRYRADVGLAPDVAVDVKGFVWENPFAETAWHTAGRVTVESETKPAFTYELAQANTTQWLFTVTPESGATALVCEEL